MDDSTTVSSTFYDETSVGEELGKYEKYPDAYAVERVWVYTVGVAGTIIGVIGIVCNILSLGVLTTKQMNTTSSMYLIALAVYDVVFLIFSTVFICVEYFYYGMTGKLDWMNAYVVPMTPVTYAFTNVTLTASVYTTIALSMDRVVGVTLPLKWPQLCTRKRVRNILIGVLVWSCVINIPLMMEYKLGYETFENVTQLSVQETEYSLSHFHKKIYLKIIIPIFESALPVVAISVVSCIIALTLQRRRQATKNLSGGPTNVSKDTNRITAQVVFISAITLLSRALRMAMFIAMEINNTTIVNYCPLYCGVLAALSFLMNMINATINFFSFCYFGTKFRKLFIMKYGWCCPWLPAVREQSEMSRNYTMTSRTVGQSNTRINSTYSVATTITNTNLSNGNISLSEGPPKANGHNAVKTE